MAIVSGIAFPLHKRIYSSWGSSVCHCHRSICVVSSEVFNCDKILEKCLATPTEEWRHRNNKSKYDNNDGVETAPTVCDEINIRQESEEELERWVLDDNLNFDLTEEEIIQEVTSHAEIESTEDATGVKWAITCDEVFSSCNHFDRLVWREGT